MSELIKRIKEGLINCYYCGFPIEESLVSRVRGDAYHDDCIKVSENIRRRGKK